MKKSSKVHVIPSFHYDVAYQKTFEEYLPKSLNNISSAIKLLEKHQDFTYCVEQVLLFREYWERNPKQHKKLKKLAREGRLFFAPGMFTMPDSNLPSGENFIRNALIGRRWLERNLGTLPDCCWMADIFGHNAQSPQLALTCGYTSYMFERGKAGGWETTFNWKGIDGSVIPSQWEIDTYFGIARGMNWRKDRPVDWRDEDLMENVFNPLLDNSPDPELLISPMGGDFRELTEEDIADVRSWNERHPELKLRFSTPAAYFRELEKTGEKLKECSDDLNPLLEGCNTSRIRIKQYNRKLEELVATLETAETVTGCSHKTSEKVWEVIAWNAFHDIICGSLVSRAVKETYKMYEKAEAKARKKIVKLLDPANPGTGEIKGAMVFNSLPYARREIVEILGKGGKKRKAPEFAEIEIPAMTLMPVPYEPTETVNPVTVSEDGKVIENHLVKIELKRNGEIGSLFDKEHQMELCGAERGMNIPLMDQDFGDPWTVKGGTNINSALLRTAPFHDPMPESGISISREGRLSPKAVDADCFAWPEPRVILSNPLVCTVEIGYHQINFTTRITVRHNDKTIYFSTSLVPMARRRRFRVGFSTSIENGKIRHSVPFGHLERPEGEYAVQGWIDYAGKDKGLLLMNKGLPGNNVTGGAMFISLFRSVVLNELDDPWYEEGVEHVFEYALMPFKPGDKSYNPARKAQLFNREVEFLPMPVKTLPGELVEPFVELDCEQAEMSCMKMEDKNLIVRIWETAGKKGEAVLKFREPVRSARKTTAAGRYLDELPCHPHELIVPLRSFEIATLQIKL